MNIAKIKKQVSDFYVEHKKSIGYTGVVIIVALIICVYFSTSPTDYPRGTIVRITKDMSVTGAANLLKEKGIIRSTLVYKIYVVLLHDGKGVQEGSYLFADPQSALRIAYRTAYGQKDMEKIKLTFIEGHSSMELASLLAKNIPGFDAKSFSVQAQKYEGYLFPETYFVDIDTQPSEIISMMREQFEEAVKPLVQEFATSTRSMKDIITMASIIEKEAGNKTDRRIISGILWKRIDEGMHLQVDVPFYYVMDIAEGGPTLKDLATESPYNTYINKGLPPGPITNPGLDSIRAALNPTPSEYYFYLADSNGVTHYAKTHDGHLANRVKYLQ
ncbi:MAG: hypothetical protein RL536_119 [Candidatus Parcubacteria bacterium]